MQDNLPAIRAQDVKPLRVIDNPFYEPEYAPPDDMPVIETNFDELRTPKSDIAKEIAAEAVGAPEFVQSLKEKRRGVGTSVAKINPYDLSVDPEFNVRDFTTPAMQKRVWELSESVATVGVEKPILVYFTGGKLCVQCGETRLRATLTAIELRGASHIRTVPIMFPAAGDNDRDRLFRQWTDNDQHQPTHLEQGLLVKKMLRYAVGDEEGEIKKIAARIGKPVVYIRTLLATQELPEEIQAHIRAGRMYPNFARSIWAKSNQHMPTAISLIEDMLAESGNTRIMPRHLPRPEGQTDTAGKRPTRATGSTRGSGTKTSRPVTRGTIETETEIVTEGGTGPGLAETSERDALGDGATMLAEHIRSCTIVVGADGMEQIRPPSVDVLEMIKILSGLHSEHETLQQVDAVPDDMPDDTTPTGILTADSEEVEPEEFISHGDETADEDETAEEHAEPDLDATSEDDQESVAAHG